MAPVGVAIKYDNVKPIINVIIDTTTDDITVLLNFLNILIEVNVGNIINELISNDPTNLIPNTTIIEHNVENIMLYKFTLIPIDLAKLSSNVIANILL